MTFSHSGHNVAGACAKWICGCCSEREGAGLKKAIWDELFFFLFCHLTLKQSNTSAAPPPARKMLVVDGAGWCSSLDQLLAHIEASDFISIKSDNTRYLFHVPISHGLKLRLVFSFFILTQTVTFHNLAHASQVKQMLRRCVRRCVGGLAGSRGVSESGGRKILSTCHLLFT